MPARVIELPAWLLMDLAESRLPCRCRDRRRLARQLVVEALPKALGPALDDLPVADPVDVELTERHAVSSRRDAEVLLRVRAFGDRVVGDEVALRHDEIDPRANVRKPAADDAQHLLERITIRGGVRRSVVQDPVRRVVPIDGLGLSLAKDFLRDAPDERFVLFGRHLTLPFSPAGAGKRGHTPGPTACQAS